MSHLLNYCGYFFIATTLLLFGVNPTAASSFDLSSDNLASELHKALSEQVAGDVIRLPEGHFYFEKGLNIVGKNITVIGSGKTKTILDFTNQIEGAQAINVRGWDIVLEGFSILHPKGDGLVVRNSARVNVSNIKINMSDPKGERPGAYGIYPVSSHNITLDGIEVSGASDAGIYLGQSKFSKIKNSRAHDNVTGLNIENSTNVEVVDSEFFNNSIGGFLVSLPDLIYPKTESILLRNNRFFNNEKYNFAEKSSLVHQLKNGKGLVLIATKNIWLENNYVGGHSSAPLVIEEYSYLQRPPHPGTFNPSVENTWLLNNEFATDKGLFKQRTDAWIRYQSQQSESEFSLSKDQTQPLKLDVDLPKQLIQ